MAQLIINTNKGEDISLSNKNTRTNKIIVCVNTDYGFCSIEINADHALQIINHLKEQFGI